MIGYVILGTNDLPRARAFYDALLAEMGVESRATVETATSWTCTATDEPLPAD